MAPYVGFCGPTYQALSPAIAADRCVNWYAESAPATAKAQVSYYPTPGLIQLADGSAYGAGRGAFALNGRKFAVCGGTFLEFDSAGNITFWGDGLANDGLPVTIVANSRTPSQIMVAAGDHGYLFDTASGANIQPITGGFEPDGVTPGAFFGARTCAFLDELLIAQTPNSNNIQISGLNDGINWSALDVSTNGGSADNLVGIITDHEYLYQFGNKRCLVYYNSGNADFPIVPVSGAFIEQGLRARASLKRIDNTLMWLGENEDGGAVLYRAAGFVPTRVSTHAVEAAWAKYTRTHDAVAMVVQQIGHTQYRITFPAGDATWVYDLATDMWHERASFRASDGTMHAQTQQFHCYDAGRNYMVGSDGIIYKEDQATYTDAGRPIRRVRVGPVVYNANKRMFVSRLEIVTQPGVGLDGDPTAQGANPQMMLRYSSDGDWSSEITASPGLIGDSKGRVIYDQLGSARAWFAEISVTDPVNWVIVGAEIEVKPGSH